MKKILLLAVSGLVALLAAIPPSLAQAPITGIQGTSDESVTVNFRELAAQAKAAPPTAPPRMIPTHRPVSPALPPEPVPATPASPAAPQTSPGDGTR
jgi:hypothetical protein